jgi:hypothetical protein
MIEGINCLLRFGTNEKDANVIGIVGRFSAVQKTNIEKHHILGSINPLIDKQSYTIISLDEFKPRKDLLSDDFNIHNMPNLIETIRHLQEHNILNETDIAYVDFFDKKNNKIVAYFNDVRVNPDGYTMIAVKESL